MVLVSILRANRFRKAPERGGSAGLGDVYAKKISVKQTSTDHPEFSGSRPHPFWLRHAACRLC